MIHLLVSAFLLSMVHAAIPNHWLPIVAIGKGEIGYVEYIQNLTQATNIKSQYLDYLNQYNQTIININYLTAAN